MMTEDHSEWVEEVRSRDEIGEQINELIAENSALRSALRAMLPTDPEFDNSACDECDGTDEDCKIANGNNEFCHWRKATKVARELLTEVKS
jgi:hypothetical protein